MATTAAAAATAPEEATTRRDRPDDRDILIIISPLDEGNELGQATRESAENHPSSALTPDAEGSGGTPSRRRTGLAAGAMRGVARMTDVINATEKASNLAWRRARCGGTTRRRRDQ
jgi:hypothetical protein